MIWRTMNREFFQKPNNNKNGQNEEKKVVDIALESSELRMKIMVTLLARDDEGKRIFGLSSSSSS
jgi:hypothetical protein